MENGNSFLLQEELRLYPGKKNYTVTLTRTQILIEQENSSKLEIISLDDVIGCHILQEKKKSATTSYICFFSYPIRKKTFGSGKYRKRVTRTFAINSRKSYEENLSVAEMWKKTIKRLIRGENIRTEQDIKGGSLPTRNLLVLVNPFSGVRRAMSMYSDKVRPMFTEAEIKHTVRKTKYPGHAKEIIMDMTLGEWDGVVVVSGDGLVHEVINGMMERPDWDEAIKTPIGIVPGGSGNALAAAVVFQSTGLANVANDPVICIFEVCRGAVSAMDLVGVEMGNSDSQNRAKIYQNECTTGTPGTSNVNPDHRREVFSFMNTVIGLISDIDIESESLRCFGGDLRNVIYAVIRIIKLRQYPLKLSYLPIEPKEDVRDCNAYTSSSPLNPAAGDGWTPKPTVDEDPSTLNGGGDAATKITPKKTKRFDAVSRETTLPPLDSPLPDDWVIEEGNYIVVMANYISHIAHNALNDRGCQMNDGKIMLHKVPISAGRCFLMDIWDQMEDGSGISGDMKLQDGSLPSVTCTAFRIEPQPCHSNIMTLDGERIPFGPLQCRILPGLCRIMSSHSNIQTTSL